MKIAPSTPVRTGKGLITPAATPSNKFDTQALNSLVSDSESVAFYCSIYVLIFHRSDVDVLSSHIKYESDLYKIDYGFTLDPASWDIVLAADTLQSLADPLVHTTDILVDMPLIPEYVSHSQNFL